MISLRPYQSAAVEAIRNEIRAGHKRILFVLPTGGGKTVTFSYIASRSVQSGKRVGIFCHRAELVEQISRALADFKVPHGIIAADYPMLNGMGCYVISAQTYARRVPQMPRFDLTIVDEAHHCTPGSTWDQCLEHGARGTVLGVTATPCRLDGRALGDTFQSIVLGPTPAELIGLGALSKYRLITPRKQIDPSALPRRMGEIVASAAADAVDKPSITGDAIEHYRQYMDGKPAVAFCASVAHAQHVAAEFSAKGYTAVSLDGKMDKALRRNLVRDFGAGRVQVLTSVDVVSEGFDVPGIVGAIMLRPTASLSLYLQQAGRALRVAAGKEFAFILDHVGNAGRLVNGDWQENHGFPDDDRTWSLEGRQGARMPAEVAVQPGRRCPKCLSVTRRPACACGFVFPVAARQVEQVAGSLGEVDIERARRERPPAEVTRLKEQAGARSLEALADLGIMRARAKAAAEGRPFTDEDEARAKRWASHVWESRGKKRGRAA